MLNLVCLEGGREGGREQQTREGSVEMEWMFSAFFPVGPCAVTNDGAKTN